MWRCFLLRLAMRSYLFLRETKWNFCLELMEHKIVQVKDGAKIYPWMVRMSMTRLDETTVQCGGTLISKDRIATARHCLQNMKSGVVEFLKKTSSDNGNFTRQIKYYQIPKDRVSDYAEAVLDKPVRNIFPIDICQGKLKAGKKGLALGWGLTGHKQTISKNPNTLAEQVFRL